MNTTPDRLPLAVVRPVAIEIFKQMSPFCEEIRIAGSVRRGSSGEGGPQTVKDIDIVCIPKMAVRPSKDSLFGEDVTYNVLYEEWAEKQAEQETPLRWIKTGTREIIDWAVEPDGKYWRGFCDRIGCGVDIFLTTREQFGLTYFLKTGSAEWNTAIMVHLGRVGYRVEENYLWQGSQRIDTFKERDMFDELRLEYVEPAQRNGREDIKAA